MKKNTERYYLLFSLGTEEVRCYSESYFKEFMYDIAEDYEFSKYEFRDENDNVISIK